MLFRYPRYTGRYTRYTGRYTRYTRWYIWHARGLHKYNGNIYWLTPASPKISDLFKKSIESLPYKWRCPCHCIIIRESVVQTTRTGDRYAQASVCRNNCKPLGTPLAEPIYGADLVSRMVTKWNSSRNHPTSFARGRDHRNKKRYGRCFVNPWTVAKKRILMEKLEKSISLLTIS